MKTILCLKQSQPVCVCIRLKSVVYDSNPIHFCQIQRMSPHGPLAFCSVCVLKKKVRCSYTALAL